MSLLRGTWEVTQWERSDLAREGGGGEMEGGSGEKGSNYVARECLGCWGAEEAKTEGGRGEGKKGKRGRSSLCSSPVETQERWKAWEKEREREQAFLPSLVPSFTNLPGPGM